MPKTTRACAHVEHAHFNSSSSPKSPQTSYGLASNWKAVAWTVFLSSAVMMEGFDLVLINSFFGLERFEDKFGARLNPENRLERPKISAAWQTGLTNGTFVGEIIGLLLCGFLVDRLGYRRTMMAALTLMTAFIFVQFFAGSIKMLLAGQILCGIPWGVFQTLPTSYAADLCPPNIRPFLTTAVNISWVLGQLMGSAVLKATASIPSEWSWRLPLGLQWVWPIPLAIGTMYSPESPLWLIRHGEKQRAQMVLQRLDCTNGKADMTKALQTLVATNQTEMSLHAGTSYTDCFRGVNLRRTECTCAVWAIQILCGSILMNYSTYFFEQAGLNPNNAFTLTLGQYALGCIGTVISWPLMLFTGRRTIYLTGTAAMAAILLAIGAVGLATVQPSLSGWVVGALLILFTFVYDSTVGPICYALVTDLPSALLRPKTIVLARIAYNVAALAANSITPAMLNPAAWGWGPRATFFWAGTGLLSFVWAFVRLPEPGGRSVEEMDALFERGVAARRFASTDLQAGDD